jgi:molecular chaperone GrpE
MEEGRVTSDEEEKEESVYDLDLDGDTSEDPEAVIREAVEAVEQAEREAESTAVEVAGLQPAGEVVSEEDSSPEEKSAEVERLREELAVLQERSVRTLAEFENYQRRSERERTELKRYALMEPVREFLEVSDNLERALSAQGSADDLKQGVEMILRQMQDVLRRLGVLEIQALGQGFDPAIHEAVSRQEDSGVKVPTVMEELQRGYLLHDRLLRPTMVRVAVPPEGTRTDEQEDEETETQPDPGQTDSDGVDQPGSAGG